MSKVSKAYRVTFFDKNHIRSNVELVVYANAKYMAIDAAREQLHSLADGHIEYITNGMHGVKRTVIDHKGNEHVALVFEVSPEFYNTLVDECWGIAEVMQIKGVAKGVSSESTVAKAEESLSRNHAACERDEMDDSSATRRKKRWTRSEKRAAAAAREKAIQAAAAAHEKASRLIRVA